MPDLDAAAPGRLSPVLPFRQGPGRHPSSSDPHPLMRISSSDPRSSSTQSLAPSHAPLSDPRRKLLLVYIHGFYGNDQSFKSFPAHVHALLRALLAESHVIHSKIYPRYKTYHAIEVARDNFSAWLEPHESPTTDVILVGHSMGGLLAAEIVLMPKRGPYQSQPFKHRILGTLSLDSPFLGLHPGIVSSGIASLFHPGSQPANDSLDRLTTGPSPPSSAGASPPSADLQLGLAPSLASPPPPPDETDPYFDPPFWNDKPFQEQPFLSRLVRFAAKHRSEGIFRAVQNHLVSHLEFGGCLADYPGLVSRYNKLRALEDVDEVQAANDGHSGTSCAQVRFANYYTLSPGRPKPPKCPPSEARDSSEVSLSGLTQDDVGAPLSSDTESVKLEGQDSSASLPMPSVEDGLQDDLQSGIPTPRISVEAPRDEDMRQRPDSADSTNDQQKERGSQEASGEPEPAAILESLSAMSMQNIEPRPMEDSVAEPIKEEEVLSQPQEPAQSSADHVDLPPLPEEPSKPTMPDLEQFTDKDARKLAEKEGKRAQKAYDQAVKARSKAIREREKIVQKRRKAAQKEAEKQQKDALKAQQRLEREAEKAAAAAAAASVDGDAASTAQTDKPRKMRKFCTLPRKTNGVRDPTWVDIYMDGMDEVGAHCGLFVPGPHYDGLVGDVGSRIVTWVFDDMSKRAILEGLE
ncbi:putative serine esterase [Hirsutella rhossiliensis]|uniref:Serine esterase n=1 Tax=Hirsutella rhossiliensis TaxID=111463 RepID=A0A9P8SJP6_9HYPO|nr:putative serine esterase [Hirsutella rhossiliensis]KAH0965131.1 putative serine esterase [Hirsutella rhossiliensis]